MTGLVLVTGATGKTGGALATRLQRAGVAHRRASRHGEPPFDWAQRATWADALRDVESVYLVAPNTVADPYAVMIEFVEAAIGHGVHRFVFLSMASLPAGGPAHGQVHQWLQDNADDWTVLCPTAFMQNFSHGLYQATIRDEDRIYSNTGDGRLPFIDVDDIAACAMAVLTAPSPANAAYTLTGAESMSYDHVAGIISAACGRQITHVHVSTDAMVQRYLDRGLPEATAQLLAHSYEWIAAGGEDRTTPDVQALIGREAITFGAFATANADRWHPTTPASASAMVADE